VVEKKIDANARKHAGAVGWLGTSGYQTIVTSSARLSVNSDRISKKGAGSKLKQKKG